MSFEDVPLGAGLWDPSSRLSAHNCKGKSNKGYSCLHSCKCILYTPNAGTCRTTQCDDTCGPVSHFVGTEHGVCWTKKCTSESVHDELK